MIREESGVAIALESTIEWLAGEQVRTQLRLGRSTNAFHRDLEAIVTGAIARGQDLDLSALLRELHELALRFGLEDPGRRSGAPVDGFRGSSTLVDKAPMSGAHREQVVAGVARLGALFRRLVAQVEGAPSLTGCPELRVPDEVEVDRVFEARVALRRVASGGTAGVTIPRDHAGPVLIEVALLLEDGLRALGATTGRLLFDGESDAAGLVFELIGDRAGCFTIQVELRDIASAVVLVGMSRLVLIGEEAETSAPRNTHAVAGSVAALRDRPALLYVSRRGRTEQGEVFRIVLSGGEDWGIRREEHTALLPHDPWEWAAREAMTIAYLGRSSEVDIADMEVQHRGAEIRRTLLGGSGIDAQLASLPVGAPLHIVAEDAWAPWELVWLGDAHCGMFVGERLSVSRWMRVGEALPRHLAGGRALLVAPSSTGLNVEGERRALYGLLKGPPQEQNTMRELFALLRDEDPWGLLHFATHGEGARSASDGASLALADGKLRPDAVQPLGSTRRGPLLGALVVLNACSVGAPDSRRMGLGDWAKRLAEAGVSAVVAPAWAIEDEAAPRFASAFYQSLGKGIPVAEAVRRGRLAARKAGDPSWLAWTIHTAPGLCWPQRAG